jgi:hypothetical protein
MKFGLRTVLKCFSWAILDSISREEDIENTYSYITTIISYYSEYLYKKDKAEVKKVTLNCLEDLSDNTINNLYLLDLWGKILNLLIKKKLFEYKDLDRLSSLNNEQIDCIIIVVCKAVIYSQDETLIENKLMNLKFFIEFKNIFLQKFAELSGK